MELKMVSSLWPVFCIGLLFYSAYGFPAEDEGEQNDENSSANEPAPEIVSKPVTVIASDNENITLPCEIKNYGNSHSQIWSRGNQSMFIEEIRFPGVDKRLSRLDDRSLFIESFTKDLADTYTCAVGNSTVQHIVGYKVTVEIGHMQKTIEAGNDMVLSCKVSGYPKPVVVWQRQTASGGVQTVGKSANVTIPNVDTSYSGVYTCVAVNDANELPVSKMVTITVVNGVKAEKSVVYASADEKAELCCFVGKNSNKKESYWLRDGKDTRDLNVLENRYSIEPSGKTKLCLVIKQVKEEDLAQFTCGVVKNSVSANNNKDNRDTIVLSGAPNVPVLTSSESNVETGITEAKWKVKTFSPLLSYAVYIKRQADETDWKKYDERSLITADVEELINVQFQNLANGQYYVKLVVSNKYGSTEYVSQTPILVIDQSVPSVVMSEKSTGGDGGGATSNFNVSILCILFAVIARLWSC